MLHKRPTILFLSLLVLVLFFVGFNRVFAPFSFAQQTLICPTPKATGNNELQLIPCYITGAAEAVVQPTVSTNPLPSINLILPSSQPIPPSGSPNPSGAVCQD